MPTEATATELNGRERLLDAGAQLMVEHGIANVSLREINVKAGHRNSGAVHYYFGGRDALLDAIIERHLVPLDERRNAMLDELEQGGDPPTFRELSRVVVEPLAEQLHTQGGRWYVQLLNQLAEMPRSAGVAAPVMAASTSLARARLLIVAVLPDLAPELRQERNDMATTIVLRTLADRARRIDADNLGPTSHRTFVENIIDVVELIGTAPPSPETMGALASDPAPSSANNPAQ